MSSSSFADTLKRWLLEWDDTKTRQVMTVTLAILSGLLLGLVLQTIFKEVGDYIFPPPPILDMADPEELKALMQTVPPAALIVTLVSWALGTFSGGYCAVRMAKTGAYPAWIVGVLLFAGDVMAMIASPHPIWFNLIAVLLVACTAYGAGVLGHYVNSQNRYRAMQRAAAKGAREV